MYKPNFCAECGERVERERWRAWTSRRFCQACAARFRRRRFAWPLVACAALLIAGFVAGRMGRPASPPLVIERGGAALATLPAGGGGATQAQSGAQSQARPATAPTARYGPDGASDERPTDPDEVISICGARTKKGTPCQRRVRGAGRCWQHRGKPAMLPPAKLIVPAG